MRLLDLVDAFTELTGEPLAVDQLADVGGSVTVTVHLNGTRSARSFSQTIAVQGPLEEPAPLEDPEALA